MFERRSGILRGLDGNMYFTMCSEFKQLPYVLIILCTLADENVRLKVQSFGRQAWPA